MSVIGVVNQSLQSNQELADVKARIQTLMESSFQKTVEKNDSFSNSGDQSKMNESGSINQYALNNK